MKKKRAATLSDARVEVDKGREHYKGFLLVKWLRRTGDTMFWTVEVYPLGMSAANVPLVMTQRPTKKATLDMVVRDAKRLVGELLFLGTEFPAARVPDEYLAQQKRPFDALNPTSKTGKRMVCPAHWDLIYEKAKAGDVVPIVFNMKITAALLRQWQKDGMVRGARDEYTMQMLLDSYAPICCWLGSETFERVLAESHPAEILNRRKV